jgi:hypothetical protein
MLSREQYIKLISSFFVELNHIIQNATEADLRRSAGFSKEMDEYLVDLRNPSDEPPTVLRTAFAFVDQYAFSANKDEVLAAGYEAYKILCNRGDV